MILPGKDIASCIREHLQSEVKALSAQGITPQLVDVLIGNSEEQLSFVRIKKRLAERLGIKFHLEHLQKVPSFQEFAGILKKYSADPKVNGIIIQQPLPFQLQTASIYNYVPVEKEIEGHKLKSPFQWPLGLAVLTSIKYIFSDHTICQELLVDSKKDKHFFKQMLRHKRIVIIGRGVTAGAPIGKTLSEFKLSYLSINSKTPEPAEYIKDADIIITATGKKVISPDIVKQGVILLNVGLRRDETGLKGDYEEDEIQDVAGWYSKTPGGIGPIDVLYLFKNLIDATKLQNKL